MSFTDVPHLGMWTKPSAGFVCVESWQSYTSPVGFSGEPAEKLGMVLIAPGDRGRLSIEIGITS
jgi:galactose mutarotase-like enzyme